MAQIIQVGLGSGGMAALDLVLRYPGLTSLMLIEPDVLEPHNLERHLFFPSALGRSKLDSAVDWISNRRPDIKIQGLNNWLEDSDCQKAMCEFLPNTSLGICAVDSEPAKYFWCSIMRRFRIPWTLGEVLSGGIGGFIHVLSPEGPCYGCIASYLKRENTGNNKGKKPDYSNHEGQVKESRIPASFAAINAIASLHALATLDLLHGKPDFASFLVPLEKVDGVFQEKWKATRLGVTKNPGCLYCGFGESEMQGLDDLLQKKLADLT